MIERLKYRNDVIGLSNIICVINLEYYLLRGMIMSNQACNRIER